MWKSPDGTISKSILSSSDKKSSVKPDFNSICKVLVTECHPHVDYFQQFSVNPTNVVIGDNDGDLGRILDVCLMSMYENESAKFDISPKSSEETFSVTVNLGEVHFKGFPYDWSAKERMDLAVYHKNKGVELFKDVQHNREAAYRFTKALKLVLAIPLDVQEPPSVVDGVAVTEINTLKCSLYNNLSSCYFRKECWPMVLTVCNKVLQFEKDNVKALYKMGVAYRNEKDYEKAYEALVKVIEREPTNKAAADQMAFIRSKLKEADDRCNDMVKKMFKN